MLTRFKERFAGTPTPDIESFFARFDHFCAAQNHDDKYKCNTFQLLLDGKAFVTYMHFSEDIKTDYRLLKENMIAHYGKVKIPREKAMQSIGELSMKENETVQEFQDRVLEHTESLELNEGHRKVIFYDGLLPYIKRYVEKEKPDSMKTMKDTLITAKIAELSGPDLENEPVTKGELNNSLKKITAAITRDTFQISSVQPPQARKEAFVYRKPYIQHQSHLGPKRVARNQPRVSYNEKGHTGRRHRSFKYQTDHNGYNKTTKESTRFALTIETLQNEKNMLEKALQKQRLIISSLQETIRNLETKCNEEIKSQKLRKSITKGTRHNIIMSRDATESKSQKRESHNDNLVAGTTTTPSTLFEKASVESMKLRNNGKTNSPISDDKTEKALGFQPLKKNKIHPNGKKVKVKNNKTHRDTTEAASRKAMSTGVEVAPAPLTPPTLPTPPPQRKTETNLKQESRIGNDVAWSTQSRVKQKVEPLKDRMALKRVMSAPKTRGCFASKVTPILGWPLTNLSYAATTIYLIHRYLMECAKLAAILR